MGVEGHLLLPSGYDHEIFVENFIGGKIGLDHESFVRYIVHLNKVAGGGASGADVPSGRFSTAGMTMVVWLAQGLRTSASLISFES